MKDVFGKALIEHFNGGSPYCTIRREDGFSEKVDISSYFVEYSKWDNFEKEVLKYAYGRVLDIGAGTGKHSLYLQNKGFEVYAIDISPLTVAIMKQRGVRNAQVMDLMELKFPENYFDAILMMFNVFGLGETIENTKKILKVLYKISTPVGKIIATITNPYKTENPYHLAYHKRNREASRPAGRVRIRTEYRGEIGDWFCQLIISPEELRMIIKSTGWNVLTTAGEEGEIYGVVLEKL